MRPKLFVSGNCVRHLLVFGILLIGTWCSTAADPKLKLEAQLIMGTSENKPPSPNYKSVGPDVKAKLKGLPLQWPNYFEVNRKQFDVPQAGTRTVTLSEKRQIEVKNLGSSSIEVVHFCKHEQLVKLTQSLPRGEILVLGGNAPKSNAWLVILKRID